MAQGGLREAGKKAAFWPTLLKDWLSPKRKKEGQGLRGPSTGSPQRNAKPLVVEVSLSKQRCSHAAERGGWACSSSPGAGKEEGWGSQGWAAASTSTEQRSWQILWAPAQGYSDAPLIFCGPCCRHALFSEQVGELGTASATAKQLSLAPILCHRPPLSP